MSKISSPSLLIMSVLMLLLLLVCERAANSADHKCCVDQPPPINKVEKVGTQTRYRPVTASQSYSTSCGLFGWRRCRRSRTYTVSQSYRVDIYKMKTYTQPCRRYECCNGYVMLKDICYANKELETAVNHVADIKDGLSDLGNIDLGDAFGAIHDVVG